MYFTILRIYEWFLKRPVIGFLFLGAFVAWLLLLPFFLSGCGTPSTYVLFAQNAKGDIAMERAITLRMPLGNQPGGATISCQAGKARVTATKIDERRVRVHDIDGEEWTSETPYDGIPIGLPIYWPEGRAEHCGIDPLAPIGTQAYVLWGQIYLFMLRLDQDTVRYRIADEVLDLPYPLTPEGRSELRKRSLPTELAELLY